MSILSKLKTPIYTASGSVARDHLASERTFLAWIRTGLGFVALGIAVERFSQLDVPQLVRELQCRDSASTSDQTSQPRPTSTAGEEEVLVGSLLGIGMGSMAYGGARYFSNMHLLSKGLYKPSYYGAAILGVAVTGLGAVAYVETLRNEVKKDVAASRRS